MKAIIFDRDGTLMEFVDYPDHPDQVRLIPAAHKLWDLKKEYPLFLHSNQSGPVRGKMTVDQMHSVQDEFIAQLGGNPFTSICLATDCPTTRGGLRKPSPVFVREVCAIFNIPPSAVVVIGDSECDALAAYNAGAKCILIRSPRNGNIPPGTLVADDLEQALSLL